MNDVNNLTQLNYFTTPIFFENKSEFLNDVNNICDKYIEDAKKANETLILEREKKLEKKIGDFGMSHHSTSLLENKDLQEFSSYIAKKSFEILDYMGYNLENYSLYFNDLWVQEFSEKGGGHHESHSHSNNHMSGFYFLKCSDKTSFPIFHDPRYSKSMIQLPLKNENELSLATEKIFFKPTPGILIYFPAYLAHQFVLDNGIETFRFIHFNLQALKNR